MAHGPSQREIAEGDPKGRLETAVARETFPTPTVGVGPNSHGQISGDFRQAMAERGVSGGSLNPTWVCWLMNWPLGWDSLEPLTDIGEWGPFNSDWWTEEPEGVPRVAKGVPDRVNRLKMLGNGWVPQTAVAVISQVMQQLIVAEGLE